MKIRFHAVDSIAEDLDAIQGRIAVRASEIFRARGGAFGRAVDDWLKAEKETIWRPALEVHRTQDAFVVEAAVAGVTPGQLDVRVTPSELLIAAELHHLHREQEGAAVLCEFANGPLFRSYKFPEPVETSRVKAECHDGLLRVTAPIAQPATRVEIHAS